MPEIEAFNWNEVASVPFEDVPTSSVPDGTYKVVVREVTKQINKKAGNPVYVLQLTVLEGEFAETILFHRFNLPMAETPMTKLRFWKGQIDDFQVVMGIPEDDRKSGIIDPKRWIGETCWVKTKDEPYEGRSSVKIVQFFDADPAKAA